MRLRRFADTFAKSRSMVTLVALMTTFGGLALLIDRQKGIILEWLAIPLLAFGGGLFVLALWPAEYSTAATKRPLASRFLRSLTLDGRMVPYFPVIGVGIIIADLAYNWMLSATPALQTEDTIVLLGASSLLGYGLVPDRFKRERDFILLFFIWLNALLVIPLLIARIVYADLEKSVDGYSWVALAPQTSAVLTLLGVSNQVHAVAGSTAPGLTFTPQHLSVQVTVVITTACSGIYSFGIFASAFVAFVLTEYERFSSEIWLLLALGLLAAYVANVLRMVIIILVGYYTDTAATDLQNLLIAHSYAGWLIFLAWIGLFWGVILRFTQKAPESQAIGQAGGARKRPEATCAICAQVLSPLLPAMRCDCGTYYHMGCFIEKGRRCPSCGRWSPPKAEGSGVTAEP